MGYQTTEALAERKLKPWLRSGVISREQYKELIAYCVEQGFWAAMGRATKTKYANIAHGYLGKGIYDLSLQAPNPVRSRTQSTQIRSYQYRTVSIPKRDLLHNDYVSSGMWSERRQKRHRTWINGHFLADGSDVRQHLERKYPGWSLYRSSHRGIYVLRRELEISSPSLPVSEDGF